MRQLLYTNYESGQSGLSNAIMSIECGVLMAFLTNRFLLLDGNVSPPANVVEYGGRVDNRHPSRVTDLIELPVAWSEPDDGTFADTGRELTSYSLMDTVFYVPGTVDITSEDASCFAHGRKQWICEDDALRDVDVLRVSETPQVPGGDRHRNNLCFYSYQFYFDEETRRSAYQVLERMRAKAPYADLARRVASDLGRFNAVHMRRGDFKVTYGVTVLDRQPWEAVDALDKHFSRDQRLLICTDERDDPFFDELKSAWTDHVFIDHHILDHYADEFFALPRHDSIALAYLSQLVAAESEDFIGTMTSTFTSIIQRYRGNRGRPEPFKFLWNELPDPGTRSERGRHPVSDCVPLEDGIMVEEFEGPWSWNRYNPRINPAWMREWPESFLTDTVLETGSLAGKERIPVTRPAGELRATEARFHFEGLGVTIRSTVPGLAFRLGEVLHQGPHERAGSNIASVEIRARGSRYALIAGGETVGEAASRDDIAAELIRYLVPLLCHARRRHLWLRGVLFRRDGRAIIYTGDLGSTRETVADALCTAGWDYLGDEVIPVRVENLEALPFARLGWPAGAAARPDWQEIRITAIVHGQHRPLARARLEALTPAVAAAELMQQSIDFRFDRKRAVERVCQVASVLPAYLMNFNESAGVPGLLEFMSEAEDAGTSSVSRGSRAGVA